VIYFKNYFLAKEKDIGNISYKLIPPETSILWPFIQSPSSLHKKAITPPISFAGLFFPMQSWKPETFFFRDYPGWRHY